MCLWLTITHHPAVNAIQMMEEIKRRVAGELNSARCHWMHHQGEVVTRDSAHSPCCVHFPEPSYYQHHMLPVTQERQEVSLLVGFRAELVYSWKIAEVSWWAWVALPWQAAPSHCGVMWPGMLWRPPMAVVLTCLSVDTDSYHQSITNYFADRRKRWERTGKGVGSW